MVDISVGSATLALSLVGIIALVAILVIAIKRNYAKKGAGELAEKYHDQTQASALAVRNKYPEVDVFNMSGTFFNVGLALALGLVVLAFGWTQYEKKVIIPDDALLIDEDIEMEPPRTAEPPPPPPPPPPPVIEEVPEELIEDEEQPEFVDQSIDEKTTVEAPVVVKRDAPPPPPQPPPPPPKEEEIFKEVEEMPRFPGCENLPTTDEKKKCADQKMLEFIYKNIKYPAIARENGIEGMVVVTFVVETDGSVTDARIVRDIGGQCGQEALRVTQLMNDQGIKWVPGKQRGRNVRVQFNLPVRFKLE